MFDEGFYRKPKAILTNMKYWGQNIFGQKYFRYIFLYRKLYFWPQYFTVVNIAFGKNICQKNSTKTDYDIVNIFQKNFTNYKSKYDQAIILHFDPENSLSFKVFQYIRVVVEVIDFKKFC